MGSYEIRETKEVLRRRVMSDAYDYPDADAIPPVKPKAPHALTREQVEDICTAIRESTYPWKHHANFINETDAALRQSLSQQAQEVERLKGLLQHYSESDTLP